MPAGTLSSHALSVDEDMPVSQTESCGWVWLPENRFEAVAETEASSHFLAEETDMLKTRLARHRRHRTMGRIAAKDAVRSYLSSVGEACPPVSGIEISYDNVGCPLAVLPNGERLCISIAHSGDIAVAMSSDAAIGIDIERVREYPRGMEEFVMAAREKEVLAAEMHGGGSIGETARCKAFLRFWTAKEAVSKAVGTGLAGRFDDFEIMDACQEILNVCHHPSRTRYQVHTSTLLDPPDSASERTEYIVAWTRKGGF